MTERLIPYKDYTRSGLKGYGEIRYVEEEKSMLVSIHYIRRVRYVSPNWNFDNYLYVVCHGEYQDISCFIWDEHYMPNQYRDIYYYDEEHNYYRMFYKRIVSRFKKNNFSISKHLTEVSDEFSEEEILKFYRREYRD